MANVASVPENGLDLDHSFPTFSLCPTSGEVRPCLRSHVWAPHCVPSPESQLVSGSEVRSKAWGQGRFPRLWDGGPSHPLLRGSRWEKPCAPRIGPRLLLEPGMTQTLMT